MAGEARITQLPVEVIAQGNSSARLTQVAVEAIAIGESKARLTQVAVEVITSNESRARLTQVAVEVICTIPVAPLEPVIDAAAAVAWPVIDFAEHTHTIEAWTVDSALSLDWEPLADPVWEFDVDAVSALAWDLTIGADWRIDGGLTFAAELNVSHSIADWTAAGETAVEFEELYVDNIYWDIGAELDLKWITGGTFKDGICILATADEVSIDGPPSGSGGGTPRNHLY